jgi:hypothetical protein
MTENDIPTAYQYAEGASSEALARYDEGREDEIQGGPPVRDAQAAEQKLLELANAIEADHAARLPVEVINRQLRCRPLLLKDASNGLVQCTRVRSIRLSHLLVRSTTAAR